MCWTLPLRSSWRTLVATSRCGAVLVLPIRGPWRHRGRRRGAKVQIAQRHPIFHQTVRTVQVSQSSWWASRDVMDQVPGAVGQPQEKLLQWAHQGDQHTPPPLWSWQGHIRVLHLDRYRQGHHWRTLLPWQWAARGHCWRWQRAEPDRRSSQEIHQKAQREKQCNEVVLQGGRCARLYSDHQGRPAFRPGHGLRRHQPVVPANGRSHPENQDSHENDEIHWPQWLYRRSVHARLSRCRVAADRHHPRWWVGLDHVIGWRRQHTSWPVIFRPARMRLLSRRVGQLAPRRDADVRTPFSSWEHFQLDRQVHGRSVQQVACQARQPVDRQREHHDGPSCWRRHPPRHLRRQQRVAHLVPTASDRHYGQGGCRGHRQLRLVQEGLHVFCLPARTGQPHHKDERQVPKEDESLGAPRPPAQLLHILSLLVAGVHQGQSARPNTVGPVVDHHVCGGVGD